MIKHICIDWGNTLCPVTGEFSGPMIDWPKLSLFQGVQAALEKLQQEYDLSIATNAKESSRSQIEAVMERLDCSQYFRNIFTPAEIGLGKENPAFYHVIAKKLGLAPQEVLMIGDDIELDIHNAFEAGFQTCLYHPENTIPHTMYVPLQQYEVKSWDELLSVIHIPRPTISEALSWLQKEQGSYVLLQHVQTVAAITYWLALKLRKNGIVVDPILAHRAALLHDLDKLSPGRMRTEHGAAGGRMLAEMGYPQVGEIVGSHVISSPDQISLKTKEAELVFFADKLVKHNQIVSVQERFDDLDSRYPQNKEFRHLVEPFLMDMQANLCKQIGIFPDDLLSEIRSDLIG